MGATSQAAAVPPRAATAPRLGNCAQTLRSGKLHENTHYTFLRQ